MTLSISLMAATVSLAPVAHAGMPYGNYEVRTPRDPGHSWLRDIRPCEPGHPADCVQDQAQPRPNGQATPWFGVAHLANGTYTDVYTWDAVALTGSVTSTFDAGCGGAPGGSADWPFSLVLF